MLKYLRLINTLTMHTMSGIPSILLLSGVALLSGCAKEPPARSVQEFMDNPIALEAAMVRCAQNRSESRYDAECVNARQAVSIIEAKEERARRDALEAQSQRKREALWRTQKAAAQARRRAADAEQRRKEAEYLAQFGVLPPPPDGESQADNANVPGAVIPTGPSDAPAQQESNVVFDDLPPRNPAESATDGGNAPVVAEDPDPARNLSDVRDELRRRNEENND